MSLLFISFEDLKKGINNLFLEEEIEFLKLVFDENELFELE